MGNPAYDKALQLLARRDHFRGELVEKLRRKGLPDDDVERAVDRLDELGLLDDDTLAKRFVEFRSVDRGWGPHRLAVELRRRGVDRDLAERSAELEDAVHDEALAVAVRRVEIRAREGWWRLPEGRARLIQSLIGRGFEVDAAHRAIDELAAERETTDHETDDQPGDPGRFP